MHKPQLDWSERYALRLQLLQEYLHVFYRSSSLIYQADAEKFQGMVVCFVMLNARRKIAKYQLQSRGQLSL